LPARSFFPPFLPPFLNGRSFTPPAVIEAFFFLVPPEIAIGCFLFFSLPWMLFCRDGLFLFTEEDVAFPHRLRQLSPPPPSPQFPSLLSFWHSRPSRFLPSPDGHEIWLFFLSSDSPLPRSSASFHCVPKQSPPLLSMPKPQTAFPPSVFSAREAWWGRTFFFSPQSFPVPLSFLSVPLTSLISPYWVKILAIPLSLFPSRKCFFSFPPSPPPAFSIFYCHHFRDP